MENLDRQHCVSETPEVARTANECVRHILWTLWACQERADFTMILRFSGFPQNVESPYAHLADAVSVCWRHRSLVQLVGGFQPHRTWGPWHTIYKSNRTYLVGLRNCVYERLKHSQIHCFHMQWFFSHRYRQVGRIAPVEMLLSAPLGSTQLPYLHCVPVLHWQSGGNFCVLEPLLAHLDCVFEGRDYAFFVTLTHFSTI